MCPGCKHLHSVPPDRWNWNKSIETPTLSPSVRHYYTHPDKGDITTCHYFVQEGRIQFCGDCPHLLSGQTVDLPEITDKDKEYLGIS